MHNNSKNEHMTIINIIYISLHFDSICILQFADAYIRHLASMSSIRWIILYPLRFMHSQ